jgi:iron complex outermembrane recepter protein
VRIHLNDQQGAKMQNHLLPKKQLLALSIASIFAADLASAQTTAAPEETPTTVVVTGTRVPNRSALDTASPVDIISAESLKNNGVTEISQALSVALPSLNFPRPGLTDGTDTVRPVTLRGLGPDQTLVLVNSKRRHAASLVNVNGTVGRGSAAVDLNTIPAAAVRAIEVLRDGASAQYGSDAIAGVINVRLRTNRDGGEFTTTYGQRITDYDVLAASPPAGANWGAAPASRSRHDGEIINVSGWKGLAWGDAGFVMLAAEYLDQKHTERSGYDMRSLYPKVNGAFDAREAIVNRFDTWYGEPEMVQSTMFLNAANPLSGGIKLYGWTSYQQRNSHSAANFRLPNATTNVAAIYPDGFVPLIAPLVEDVSATGGLTWTSGEWDMDASLGYGRNRMHYTVDNTLNRSYGVNSKTSLDAGGFEYNQTVFNLSGQRTVDVAALSSPLNVALGAELRREDYDLFAGEAQSWDNGGVLVNNTPILGAQGFPGFRPSDASSTGRSALGAYVDLEANLSKQFLGSAALRAEHYSDFGNSLAGKLAGRYDFSKEFALRASLQNGFRAPSPQQQNFTTTSTNFINGVPFDIITFKPSNPAAQALGAKPLDAEKSVNASLGAVIRAGKVSITIDAYRINIKDRIVLSENLTAANVQALLVSKGFTGVGGARFFINGVDTKTEGVDAVLNWPLTTGAAGKFDFTLAANFTSTEVTKTPVTAELAALRPAPILFGRLNVLAFEKGQPKNKLSATANWKMGQWGATLRATRYGEVLDPGTTAALDFVLPAKTLVDVEARYAINKHIALQVGADNLFDAYPDPRPPALNSTGAAMFSQYSPFGRSGRYVFARMSFTF